MYGSIKVTADTLRSKAFGSITNSYTTLGSATTTHARMVRIINNTDGDMFLSLNGTNDMFFVPAGSFVLYDFTTNRSQNATTFVLPIGTQFSIRYSSAPSKNAVYLEVIYGA